MASNIINKSAITWKVAAIHSWNIKFHIILFYSKRIQTRDKRISIIVLNIISSIYLSLQHSIEIWNCNIHAALRYISFYKEKSDSFNNSVWTYRILQHIDIIDNIIIQPCRIIKNKKMGEDFIHNPLLIISFHSPVL